ncbi:MAG: adenylate/guanylate cyclase domain-containing protein [Spirochaetales bacterium]|uniref:Adenylate/guanylate cyclase domain-containing protein n=1 Tax=Candidatus Thalassospirochaeta sargassi TaxID=3119039 RepID=A0AAJ1MP79_9SPIO|nr:adenylate/guanylate cyclase domain-containing protein [Spirochaetales bacterium]
MLEPSLINETAELVSQNFSADEIDRIGGMLIKGYSSHNICGEAEHITFSSGKASRILISYMNSKRKTFDLLKLLIELDGSSLSGKPIALKGLEEYLNKLTRTGVVYDFHKRKIHHSRKDVENLVNWGALKEGKYYGFTIISLDIVGNSKLVKAHGLKKMEKVYFHLRQFITNKVYEYDGRIWSFAGDGGIIAFTAKGNEQRAVLCALDIQSSLPVFNLRPEIPIKDKIILRLGLDCGKFRFSMDTGHIVSDAINYAAHLEKSGTEPGQISISSRVKKELNAKMGKYFPNPFEFESERSFTSCL